MMPDKRIGPLGISQQLFAASLALADGFEKLTHAFFGHEKRCGKRIRTHFKQIAII